MATIKHAIEEHDVVALRVPIGAWPAGTSGTVVGLYDGAALVEVAASAVEPCNSLRRVSFCLGMIPPVLLVIPRPSKARSPESITTTLSVQHHHARQQSTVLSL